MKVFGDAKGGPSAKGPVPVPPASSSRSPAVPLLWTAMRKATSPAPPPGAPIGVSSPGDRLEKEADRVAEEVTKDKQASTASPPASAAPPLPPVAPPSRPACTQCSKVGPCPSCRGRIQRAAIAGPAAALAPAFARAPEFFPLNAGRPLDATIRRDLEPRFGRDLGAVRVHTDVDATAAAARLSARAFTLGPDIFFGRGEYAPATPGGRRLLAHELAHVVQQGQGAPPMVQRAPVDGQTREAAADELSANAITLFDRAALLSFGEVGDLLERADTLQMQFEDESRPRSRLAAARALLAIFQILKEREQVAPRGANGELLRTNLVGKAVGPWTPRRPQRLEQIPMFHPDNVAAWAGASIMGAPSRPPAVPPAAAAPRRRARSRPRPADGGGGRESAPPEQAKSSLIVRSLIETAPVEAQEPGGGAEINAGLKKLEGATIGQAVEAVAASQEEGAPALQRKLPKNAAATLFEATGLVLFIARRIYALDRSGHIVAGDIGDFAFEADVLTPSLSKGGTFFMGRFQVGERSAEGQVVRPILEVDGAATRLVGGQVFVKSKSTAFDPLRDLTERAFAEKLGVAIVVSSHYRPGPAETATPLRNAVRAIVGTRKYLAFEIARAIEDQIENPESWVQGKLTSKATAAVAGGNPAVAAVLLGVDVLQKVEFVATLNNITAFARSDDEVDIASQTIARVIAAFLVGAVADKLAGAVTAGIGHMGRKMRPAAAGGGKPGGGVPPPGGPQPPASSPPVPSGGGGPPKAPATTPPTTTPHATTPPTTTPPTTTPHATTPPTTTPPTTTPHATTPPTTTSPTTTPSAAPAPAGETPEQKKARQLADLPRHKREQAEKQQAKLQEEHKRNVADAEKRGLLPQAGTDDRKWLDDDPTGRRKELAFDPKQKKFLVREGQAALEAEARGKPRPLDPPVRRALAPNEKEPGADFIDGKGVEWDHTRVTSVAKAEATIGKKANPLAPGSQGKRTIADLRDLSSADAKKVMDAWTNATHAAGTGEVVFVFP